MPSGQAVAMTQRRFDSFHQVSNWKFYLQSVVQRHQSLLALRDLRHLTVYFQLWYPFKTTRIQLSIKLQERCDKGKKNWNTRSIRSTLLTLGPCHFRRLKCMDRHKGRNDSKQRTANQTIGWWTQINLLMISNNSRIHCRTEILNSSTEQTCIWRLGLPPCENLWNFFFVSLGSSAIIANSEE